jgi:hypothetical protein
MLPFSTQKNREPFDGLIESAAICITAELKRSKGNGLFTRQPAESISFIAKIGYPIWLFPQKNSILIFDGLSDSSVTITYKEAPSAAAFMESLQENQRPRENFISFLADHNAYFSQPPTERQFSLRGLVLSFDFKNEFTSFYRDATEIVAPVPLLLPTLAEREISMGLYELDKVQTLLKTDEDILSECSRLLSKITRQCLTEIDYEAAACREESNARVKAQEECIKPQLLKISKEYSIKIKHLSECYDRELHNLYLLRDKIQRLIQSDELKIKRYVLEAHTQKEKGHKIYEKRWKEKIKKLQREISALKKELRKTHKNINVKSQEKVVGVSRLNNELSAEIKLIRQPIIELKNILNAKMLAFRKETNNLLVMEKALLLDMDKSLKLRQEIDAVFDTLGFIDHQFKNRALFYVPFYVICYEGGLSRRYVCISPSTISSADFSTKLKGAFGFSKIQDLLAPNFRTIAELIKKIEEHASHNSVLEDQLRNLGEKNNLLRNSDFCASIEKGLVLLRNEGWLSEREVADLQSRITVGR